jgi:hypothetical protein
MEEIVIKAYLQGKRNIEQHHKKAKEPEVKVQLKLELDLAEKEKKVLVDEIKSNVKFVRNAIDKLSKFKHELTDLAKACGTTRESLVNGIELILKTFGTSKESYHGGDYNGVLIRMILQFAK